MRGTKHITPEDVRTRVSGIRAMVRAPGNTDWEAVHILVDEILEDVLDAIANGAPRPAALAREAMRTIQIDGPRWYA